MEVTRSNLKPSMPSKSRKLLKEQALAAWRFKPSNTAKEQDANVAWIFQASQRDIQIVTRALERELNSRPEEGVINRTSNDTIAGTCTSDVESLSMSSSDPGSPSDTVVQAKASLEVLDFKADQFEAPRIRMPPVETLSRSSNDQRSIPTINNFAGKKRSRRRNRAPIKIMAADPADFQAMVHQMTGFPLKNSSRVAPSLLKTQPKWLSLIGIDNIPSVLTKFDSSSLRLPDAINGLFGSHPNICIQQPSAAI